MTENSHSTPSESQKPHQEVKATLWKGVVGAVSLAGATAIPLVVNRLLTPTAPPVTTPAAAIVQPAEATQASPQLTPTSDERVDAEKPGKRDKKKKH